MHILLTNDDGVTARGINALFDVFSRRHEVSMIAPNRELSACSSAITIRNPVTVERVSERIYAIDGYPADCVNIGVNAKLIPGIDLVVSGINHGPNMGADIFFSGTVAGARMAYIFGLPAIAVSLDCHDGSAYFDDVARFLLDYLDRIAPGGRMEHVLLNINYPNVAAGAVAGIAYTSLGTRNYIDSYLRVGGDDRELRLQLRGTIRSSGPDGCDIVEVSKNRISVTPLSLDCTDYGFLERTGQEEHV